MSLLSFSLSPELSFLLSEAVAALFFVCKLGFLLSAAVAALLSIFFSRILGATRSEMEKKNKTILKKTLAGRGGERNGKEK